MRMHALLPAAVLLCGCGLRRGPAAPEPARGPARDSLFRIDQSRADSVAVRGAAEGSLALFADNVVYLHAGAPAVYTRAAAARVATAALAGNNAPVSWEPIAGGVSDDLQSGYTYGVVARAASPEAKRALRFERYVAFWRRGRGQPWRIIAFAQVGGVPLPPNLLDVAGLDTMPSPQPLPKALDQARAAVRSADSVFSDLSYRMGTAFAFGNSVAEDGAVFGSPALIIGPRAVREYYGSPNDESSLTWRPVHADVAGSMDLGFTIGEYVSTGRGPSGAAVQRSGKYLTVWKRQKDGAWRFLIDGGNPR